MAAFRDLSVSWKTTIVSMLTIVLVLTITCAAFFVFDLLSFRRDLVARLVTEARIVGLSSAPARLFDDATSARQPLDALSSHTQIVSAAVYAKDGRSFATYGGESIIDLPATASPSLVGTHFGHDHVTIVQEIEF